MTVDDPARPTRRLAGRDLAIAALTAGQLGIVVPVLAGASQIAATTSDMGIRRLLDTLTLYAKAPASIARQRRDVRPFASPHRPLATFCLRGAGGRDTLRAEVR